MLTRRNWAQVREKSFLLCTRNVIYIYGMYRVREREYGTVGGNKVHLTCKAVERRLIIGARGEVFLPGCHQMWRNH